MYFTETITSSTDYRDTLALEALKVLCASWEGSPKGLGFYCYSIADAMLEARERSSSDSEEQGE